VAHPREAIGCRSLLWRKSDSGHLATYRQGGLGSTFATLALRFSGLVPVAELTHLRRSNDEPAYSSATIESGCRLRLRTSQPIAFQ
jgi:hypothetical protein